MSKNTPELNSTHAVAVESFLLWLSVRTKKTREQLLEEDAIPLIISSVASKPDMKSSAIYLLGEIELKHPDSLMGHDALGFILDRPKPDELKIFTGKMEEHAKSYFREVESARNEVMRNIAPQVLKWLVAPDSFANEQSWACEIAQKCPDEFINFLLRPENKDREDSLSLAQMLDFGALGDKTLVLIASAIKKAPGSDVCLALTVQLSHSLRDDPKNARIEEALRAAGEEPLEQYLNFLMELKLDMRHLERISELIAETPGDKLSHKALFRMLNTIRKAGVWKDRVERDEHPKRNHSYSEEITEAHEDETAKKIANAVREVIAAKPRLKPRIESVIFACAANMDDRTWKFAGGVLLALDAEIIGKLQKMELSSNEKTRQTQLLALCHFATNSKISLPIERIPDYVWLMNNTEPEDVDREVCMHAFNAIAKANRGDKRLVTLISPILELAQHDRTKSAVGVLVSIGPAAVVPLLEEYSKHPEKAELITRALEAIKSGEHKVDAGVIAKPQKPEDMQKILSNLALDIGKAAETAPPAKVRS